MKLLIMSDLHFEFQTFSMKKKFLDQNWPKHDICVIAGDVSNAIGLYDSLKLLMLKFKRIIYVSGNHEYYNGSIESVNQTINAFEQIEENFTWLNNNSVSIDGITFYGGTLWYPECLNPKIKFGINDVYIKDYENIQIEHTKFLNGLLTIPKNSVIISHHLPHPNSIAQQFKGNEFNHFFVHDCSKQIHDLNPKLWIHGHTHNFFDYKLNSGTRIVCNPFGYPTEPRCANWQPIVVNV